MHNPYAVHSFLTLPAPKSPTPLHEAPSFQWRQCVPEHPTESLEALLEPGEPNLFQRVVMIVQDREADPRHAVALLSPRGERPSRRACKPRDELAPSHSITSS